MQDWSILMVENSLDVLPDHPLGEWSILSSFFDIICLFFSVTYKTMFIEGSKGLDLGDGGSVGEPAASRIAILPLERLERQYLEPGATFDGMTSREDIEAILETVKSAIVIDQAPWLGEIEDKTRLRRRSMSHGMFEGIERALHIGESLDVLSVSARVLSPDFYERSLTNNHTRRNFTLHDIVRLAIAAKYVIEFPNEESIDATAHGDYGVYIASVGNTGTGNTTNSIALMGNHPDPRRIIQSIRAARTRVLSPAQLDEMRWRKRRDREERLEQSRRERITRYITFPTDWEIRERAVDGRNKYHIDHPAQGGLPSLGKDSK